MKLIFALALLAVLAAGCGSVKRTVGPITVTRPTPTAVSNVKTGTRIRCPGWTGKDLRVPRQGADSTVGEPVRLTRKMKETEVMFLTHRENGAITVACEFVVPR